MRMYFTVSQYKKLQQSLWSNAIFQKENFDNVSMCRYTVPDYWDIGEVYERLIEDIYDDAEIEKGIWDIYHSWIDAHISDYNTDFYYQPRDYIAAWL